ncbi:unnamed protein product [Chondrus crispus]|uniref:Uncharacterized protein n=1 Tax=Chondrus crispus TaxID=2769 RepID=R7QNB1_CHOCR|nr:unnamed protein product [Chondrus crispus]CDF39278.1 unnamed protein product [Chondrus crispus]|eukprot:XP_005719189.1 unnamed protein product [Chondrus crispus]
MPDYCSVAFSCLKKTSAVSPPIDLSASIEILADNRNFVLNNSPLWKQTLPKPYWKRDAFSE